MLQPQCSQQNRAKGVVRISQPRDNDEKIQNHILRIDLGLVGLGTSKSSKTKPKSRVHWGLANEAIPAKTEPTSATRSLVPLSREGCSRGARTP